MIIRPGRLFISAIITLSVLWGCSKHDDNAPDNQDKKGIMLSDNSTFGSILTDKDGRTLYFFSVDADGQSGCSGDCETKWPIYSDTALSTDASINADLGTITRSDGRTQVTYKGWPLYYYADDAKAGDVNGDGVGGIWFVAKPDYSIMLASHQLVGLDGKNYLGDHQEGTGVTVYLTDDRGNTLYLFEPDKFNMNTFTKPDLSNNAAWPLYEMEVGNVPSVLSKDMTATISVSGKIQLTYKGWPLYYFGQDNTRGDTKGVSIAKWNILEADVPEAPQN